MYTLRPQFTVPFQYPVIFTTDVFDPCNRTLADQVASTGGARRCLFVLDEGLLEAQPDLTQRIQAYCEAHVNAIVSGPSFVIVPGGEIGKNDPVVVDRIQEAIHREKICRHSLVVAVGGGAVIDTVGYAAATAHRGVRIIRIPSTVLAQNDASIGVKNGVNRFGKKNFLGTFAPPLAVINDGSLLKTLAPRDLRSGISEAVKVALLKDAAFFRWMEEVRDELAVFEEGAMEYLIRRCAELHLDHIAGSGDPFEQGSARPLDFGHWAAHRLEALSGYRIRHGEAVAIGIALDSVYAHLTGLLGAEDLEAVLNFLEGVGFQLYAAEMENVAELLKGIEEFREHLGGKLALTLLTGIGAAIEVDEADEALYTAAVHQLKRRYARAVMPEQVLCDSEGQEVVI